MSITATRSATRIRTHPPIAERIRRLRALDPHTRPHGIVALAA
jgi:Zn-dependent protease with chaperone function